MYKAFLLTGPCRTAPPISLLPQRGTVQSATVLAHVAPRSAVRAVACLRGGRERRPDRRLTCSRDGFESGRKSACCINPRAPRSECRRDSRFSLPLLLPGLGCSLFRWVPGSGNYKGNVYKWVVASGKRGEDSGAHANVDTRLSSLTRPQPSSPCFAFLSPLLIPYSSASVSAASIPGTGRRS